MKPPFIAFLMMLFATTFPIHRTTALAIELTGDLDRLNEALSSGNIIEAAAIFQNLHPQETEAAGERLEQFADLLFSAYGKYDEITQEVVYSSNDLEVIAAGYLLEVNETRFSDQRFEIGSMHPVFFTGGARASLAYTARRFLNDHHGWTQAHQQLAAIYLRVGSRVHHDGFYAGLDLHGQNILDLIDRAAGHLEEQELLEYIVWLGEDLSSHKLQPGTVDRLEGSFDRAIQRLAEIAEPSLIANPSHWSIAILKKAHRTSVLRSAVSDERVKRVFVSLFPEWSLPGLCETITKLQSMTTR